MRRALTLPWLVLLVHSSYAQQYLFARYTPKDGLVNNRTRSLYQDSRGRIYITTFGGLSVYDGSRFINYTTDNGLAASLVNDVMEMGDDSLWVAPNGPALHCLVHGVIRDVHTADGFYPVINQLIRCGDGFIYGISDNGLFRYQQNRFIRIPLKDDQGHIQDGPIIQAVETNHHLLLLTDPYLGALPGPGSLMLYDLQSRRLTAIAKGPDFLFLLKTPGDSVFTATMSGVRWLDPAALRRDSIHPLPMPAPWRSVTPIFCRYLYTDQHHDLWLSTDQALIRIDAATGISQQLTTANGLPHGITAGMLRDRENNIWLANDRNGIVKWPGRPISWYPTPRPGFSVDDLGTVPGTDSVWFYDATRHSILMMEGKDSTGQLFLPDGSVPINTRLFIGKSAWATAGYDLYSLQFLPGHRYRLTPAFHTNSMGFANGSFDKKGNLILAGDKVTVIPCGQTTSIRQPVQYPLHYLCDQAATDPKGRIWTVTRNNKLLVFGIATAGTGVHLQVLASFSNIPGGSARSITVDDSGHVYIGTRDHGLYCLFFDGLHFLSLQHLTTGNGLSENFISYLHCDDDNTIWACTPAGLDRIRRDGNRFTIDNLTNSQDNFQTVYRIGAMRGGTHWALAMQGCLKIDPFPAKTTDYRPHILFSRVLVDNVPSPDTGRTILTLPYDHNTITFHIGVTTFIDEAQTRYSYLLEGSGNRQWSPLTPESAIYFVNLPPGKYNLQVRVRFLAGDYPDQRSNYAFVIRPPWWQTTWFRIAMALALIVITILGIRIYIRRRLLHQRLELENQQAIEKERTRIATDMHDELGAGLSRIKFLSETIGIKKQQHLPIEEEITGIRRYSHEMIDKMGEIVWALNERNDSLSDLLSYTRSYAAEYLLQAGIRCQVESPADLPCCFVSGEFRRNVYLTIKEALHNIVKHAQAEQVNIRMSIQPEKILLIIIEDDGIGFDRENIRPFANGLNNMQRRIAELGGTLYIYTVPGTGLRISVPL